MKRYKSLFFESYRQYEIKKLCHFLQKNFHTAFVVIGGAAYSLYTGIPANDLDIVVYDYGTLTPDNLAGGEVLNIDHENNLVKIVLFGVDIDFLKPGREYTTTEGFEFKVPSIFHNIRNIEGIEIMNEIELMASTKKHQTERFAALTKTLGLKKEAIKYLNKLHGNIGAFINAYEQVYGVDVSVEEWKQIMRGK